MVETNSQFKNVSCKFVSFRKDKRFYFVGYKDNYKIRGYIDWENFNLREDKNVISEIYINSIYFLKDFNGYIIKNMETREIFEELNWSLVTPKPIF